MYKFHDDASISSTVSNDCIGLPFVILVKIDDYLMPHFVFDVLHSGASLPDFYMLLIGSSTCSYVTQVTIWLQSEHIFYSNMTYEVGTIIISQVLGNFLSMELVYGSILRSRIQQMFNNNPTIFSPTNLDET